MTFHHASDTTVSAFVPALLSASSYAATDDLGAALAAAHQAATDAAAQASLQARAELRTAQVELYCDHRTQALQAIRRARRQLSQPQDGAAPHELAALDEAAWHVRHHEDGAALDSLDLARTQLAG
ncbi:MAG: hypothetical protein AB9M60_13815 [Leptothrix sp. (in: b-proteobacteria)]